MSPYADVDIDYKLTMALLDWRDEKAALKFPSPLVRSLGSNILLSDQIIKHLVECAHTAGTLATTEHIAKETKWRKDWVDEFADSLKEVVRNYYPQAVVRGASPTTPNNMNGTVEEEDERWERLLLQQHHHQQAFPEVRLHQFERMYPELEQPNGI
ncbi:hypothetical protein CPB83DRAFT_857452 [Crepidotus variabilis]|uniref:Uncharacterized protein n=1 Tax=Crepidotus variabilis TaxID=179855 RepID=A0A9P6EBW9_9AGAR|nr:hypothetical protein CPB83DRAFT_857452 [Crepidotus variabilis]